LNLFTQQQKALSSHHQQLIKRTNHGQRLLRSTRT